MTSVTGREAILQVLDSELASNEDVFLLGEDIALLGGAFGVTAGLFAKYGAHALEIHRFPRWQSLAQQLELRIWGCDP